MAASGPASRWEVTHRSISVAPGWARSTAGLRVLEGLDTFRKLNRKLVGLLGRRGLGCHLGMLAGRLSCYCGVASLVESIGGLPRHESVDLPVDVAVDDVPGVGVVEQQL